MRTLLTVVLIGLWPASALAQELLSEQRVIANAAYVLRRAVMYEANQLRVLSPSRAAFTGGREEPALVAELSKCVYAIASRKYAGYRIDFSKLYGSSYKECRNYQCTLNFPGRAGAACITGAFSVGDSCLNEARIPSGTPQQEEELVASVRFILATACPAADYGFKPRF